MGTIALQFQPVVIVKRLMILIIKGLTFTRHSMVKIDELETVGTINRYQKVNNLMFELCKYTDEH